MKENKQNLKEYLNSKQISMLDTIRITLALQLHSVVKMSGADTTFVGLSANNLTQVVLSDEKVESSTT